MTLPRHLCHTATVHIRDLQDAAHATAKTKGWWPPDEVSVELLGSKIALIHSEVSEALECLRGGQLEVSRAGAKPEGLPIELADIVLRVLDFAGALGIDLEDAVLEKLEYNRTRAYRHGGRAL